MRGGPARPAEGSGRAKATGDEGKPGQRGSPELSPGRKRRRLGLEGALVDERGHRGSGLTYRAAGKVLGVRARDCRGEIPGGDRGGALRGGAEEGEGADARGRLVSGGAREQAAWAEGGGHARGSLAEGACGLGRAKRRGELAWETRGSGPGWGRGWASGLGWLGKKKFGLGLGFWVAMGLGFLFLFFSF